MKKISRGSIKIKGFDDGEMDFQLLRQLASVQARAASIGECFYLADKIQSADPLQWVKSFEAQANWQKEDGLERLRKDHTISGRQQLLKACNSYRAAEYYSPTLSQRHRNFGLSSADCFVTAMSVSDLHFERHPLEYKNITLPVYFISPQNDGEKRPTLMVVSGFDGTLEELFLMHGMAAIERNYNLILFAGPGQMDIFRHYPETFFEPDFENVVKRVIDEFEHRQEVDIDSLSLLGNSIGGYFATRAAAYEPRVKALIANSPILDVHAYMASFAPEDPCDMPDKADFFIEDLPDIPDFDFPRELKVRTEQLMIRYGRHSFKNTFSYMKSFKVDEALANFSGNCLGLIGESEGQEPHAQYERFIQLTKADGYEFTSQEGASSHCQAGNIDFANAIIFDWLDSIR